MTNPKQIGVVSNDYLTNSKLGIYVAMQMTKRVSQ